MATLINGTGFTGVTSQIDADFYEGLSGGITGIMAVGQKMTAAIIDNVPRVYDGIILTKEGRRIQINYGEYDDFTIPEGSSGTTAYYIIGYKLTTAANDTQTCEAFVRSMESATATITEDMLKDGNADVYISLYRVTQVDAGNSLSDCLLPELASISSFTQQQATIEALEAAPVLLSSTAFAATSNGWTLRTMSLSAIQNYNIIYMRCILKNTDVLLTFLSNGLYGDGYYTQQVSDYDGSVWTRGLFNVDFENGRIGVACVNGTPANCKIVQVYGHHAIV